MGREGVAIAEEDGDREERPRWGRLRDGDGDGDGDGERMEAEGAVEGLGGGVPAVGSHHEESMAAHCL